MAESHKIEVRATNREAGKTVSTRDFNYSPDLDYLENDFIVPGPGAQEGFRTVFESLPRPHPSSEIIDFVRVIPSDLVLRLGDQLRVTFYESGDLPVS